MADNTGDERLEIGGGRYDQITVVVVPLLLLLLVVVVEGPA